MTHPDGPNEGHGHVFPREDGVRMRHRPETCADCQADVALKAKLEQVPAGQKNGKNDTGPVPPSIPVQAFVVNAIKRLKG